MAEFARDENGQLFMRQTGQDWQPVTEGQMEAMERGTLGNAARTFGNQVTSILARGAEMALGGQEQPYEIGPRPGRGLARSIAEGAEARNEDIRFARPGMVSAINTATDIGSMAIPGGPTVQSTRASRAATAAQRATDRVDNVIEMSRTARAADDVADGSMDAAQTSNLRSGGTSQFVSAEEAQRLGMPLTGTRREFLSAYDSGNLARMERAETRVANESYLNQQKLFGDTNVGDFRGGQDIDQWFTRQVADAAGRPDLGRIQFDDLVDIRDDAKSVLKMHLDDANVRANVKFDPPEGGAPVDLLAQARAIADIHDNTALQNLVNRLEASAKRGGGGQFENGSLLEARQVADDAAELAFKSGKEDTGSAFATINQMIDDAIEASLPEGAKEQVQFARFQWKIKKVLERTVGTMSRTEGGIIRPSQFASNWRNMTPGYRDHRRKLTDFERMMNTADNFTRERANPGNTLVRAITPAARTAVTGAVATGAGAIGMGLMQ